MMPRVKDHNPIGTQKIVSLIFEKRVASLGGRRGNSKISNPNYISARLHIEFLFHIIILERLSIEIESAAG
jgi:hypothetical protein